MARFRCDECGHTAKASDENIGRRAKCPKCKIYGVIASYAEQTEGVVKPPKLVKKRATAVSSTKLSVRPLLDVLDDNDTIPLVIASIWRIAVTVFGCLALLVWLMFLAGVSAFWKLGVFHAVVYLFNQVAILVAIVVAIQILWLRGKDISRESSAKFVVVPIIAHLVKAMTEALGACLVIIVPTATLLIAIQPRYSDLFDGGFTYYLSLFQVVLIFVCTVPIMWGLAVSVVLAGRLIADLLNATFSIANDVNNLSQG